MAKIPQNSVGFPMAVVVEGGLGIVAILLAWLFGIELRQQLPTTWAAGGQAVASGVIATLPLLLGFWWLVRAKSPAFRRLRQTVQRMIREVFPGGSIPQLALVSALAGVSEELLFRGVLQTLLERWSTPLVALVAASVVFGALHALSWLYFVLATAVGAYLGGMLLRYDDLLMPIVAHGLYDFVALVYLTRMKEPEEPVNGDVVKTITVEELHELNRKRPVELIDVRTPEEFAEVRAPIARHVPMHTIDPHQLVQSRTGDRDEPLYFICHMGGRSHRVCEAFIAAGYPNVVNVVGGTEAWEEAGLPIERG